MMKLIFNTKRSNMATTYEYVPSDCTVLNVIEWLPKDDTLPGFVVLTFLGFFIIGAILALLITRCVAREVEVKRRKETAVSAPRDPSKDVWIFGYKIYLTIVLVLMCIFLVSLLVVQIMFAAKDNGEKSRSEDHMSENFFGSVWLWATLVAVIFLPIFGYLALRCMMFPGMCQVVNDKYKEHNERKRQAKTKSTRKEHIVLVHIEKGSTEEENKKRSKTVFTNNKILPLSPAEEEGSGHIQEEVESKTTSYTTLRSDADIVEQENAQPESKQYGVSIIEILTKSSSEQMEVELQGQDLKSVIEMEDGLLQQKGETFVHIWKMILDVLFNNGRISEVYRRESIAKLEQAVDDIHRNNKLEHENESKRLKSEIEDPAELEDALESLHSNYSKKVVSEFTELQNSAANDLKEKSQLSEEEASAIVMKIQSNLAASEKFFVEEQTRQSMVLQEKLLRREALVQLRDQMNDQEKEAIENLPKKHREAFDKLCVDNPNIESQKDEILSEYEQNLARLQENHEHNVRAQQNKLALKLKQKRQERMQLLALRQQQENEEHYKKTCQQVSDGEMNLETFVEEQTKLKKKHTMEREDEEDEADKTEAEELERLRQHLEEEREKKIQSYEEHIVKKMATMAQLSSDDVEQFMEEHRKYMDLYNAKLEETKNQQRSQLKERIQARKAKLERERAQHKNEQTQLITQQEEVIDQVLKMQVGLTEEARKQVMAEHEQNLLNLNNHLQITRLRQQKRLEERLAQRKAKLAEMKKSQEEELSKNDPDKQESLMKEQNKAYEEEIKKLENEHDKALEDLRRRLALETEEALKEQDKRLGEILGKHQVGVARRDEIIRRQNETIKAIEEKMVDKLTKEGTFAENATDKILQQHQRQITKLETKINEAKQAQERNMYKKLEAKRLKKEKALSAEMNDKAEQQRKRGVRSATRVMMTTLAQTQLKHKLEELRREMELELSKQKEELNKIMEERLLEELQLHEKNFITQLASISHMNEEEISKICKQAVTESGGDQQTSRKLSKDLRKRIRMGNSSEATA